MTPHLIDARTFEALQANAGADFVLTLIEAFAEEAPRLLADLRSAAAQGAGERFETAAHTLKSNSTTFGATRLAEMARRLEWQGPSADGAAIEALAGELAATLVALRSLAQL
ncbi:MAG: Hpt domain-containing protein [Burkholderiales bacterium]|nr:Hpt domain-containing protein [Burkholderiales bacterium]